VFAVCRVLDKKRDRAFCATSLFQGVLGGMNAGMLNILTRKMISKRKGGKKAGSQGLI